MGAMYRLKAYFGMVPADELGDYVDEVESRYPTQRRGDRWDERSPDRGDRPGYDGYEADDDRADTRVEPRGDARVDDGWERSRTTVRSVASASVRGESARQRTPVTVGVPVQGALAIDRAAERDIDLDERTRTEPEQARTVSPARITTLQPRSYNEARTIGERYRDGVPVIMNLTELDDAAAKRLVDFAAGLAFALRGSIDKVTSRVFLLTPPEVEVSADDARMLAERSRHFGDR
ncbi:cell division protein SepF [Pseudonocardia sp.]|uniref:cell division protein SepF n=1 Tax=Pseudonocardia sp. TaxID=60912 RepID=UPI003D142DC0